jgi:hypothetical protein
VGAKLRNFLFATWAAWRPKNAQFRDVELNRDTNETPHDDSIMQHTIIVIGLAHSFVEKSRQLFFHQGLLQQAHAIML